MTRRMILALRVFGRSPTNLTDSGRSGLPGWRADRALISPRRAGDFDRVVGAALDEPEAVVVDQGPVAVDPDVGPARPVGLKIALAITPEAACHAGPGLANDQLADLAAD